jgi:hypothetical protein
MAGGEDRIDDGAGAWPSRWRACSWCCSAVVGLLAWKRYFSRRVSETGGAAALLSTAAGEQTGLQCAARSGRVLSSQGRGECCRCRTQSQPVVEASRRACRGRAQAEQSRAAARWTYDGAGQCDAGDAGRTVAQEEGAVLMPEGWSSAGQASFPHTPPQGDHSGWLVRRASS